MSDSADKMSTARHYFVDEAGDGTLFDGKGRVIIGNEGCSRFFILGFVDIPDPANLAQEMTHLRVTLLADPYFSGIPSMQPDQYMGFAAALRTWRRPLRRLSLVPVSPGARHR